MEKTRFANSLSQFHVTHTNQSTIVKLKKYQVGYDQRIMKLIQKCDQHAQARQSNYKELEELSKNLAKLSNRWKRLTSLIVESLLELDHETVIANEEVQKIEKKQKNLNGLLEKNQEEVNNMSNLISLLSHFIAKAESRQQERVVPNHQQYNPAIAAQSYSNALNSPLRSGSSNPGYNFSHRNYQTL